MINPYHAGYGDTQGLVTAPFAGRKDAFSRLHARLFDPINTGAILFMGQRHIGKSALLLNVGSVFSETAVGVYLPMRETTPPNEAAWLLLLAQTITNALTEQGYTLGRLSQLDPVGDQPRDWLEMAFLPQILGAVRSKLLILIDDADRLLMAIRAGQLPDDSFAYLLALTRKFQNFHFALTLDADFEADLDDFAPLVAPTDVVVLGNLLPDETQWLLQAPARGLYAVPDEVTLAVQRVVGGAPGLVQRFGSEFFKRWEAYPELNVFTIEDIKVITPSVYLYNEADYRSQWERLSVNERLVLTAISDLVFNDPLGRVDASAIQGWLVETEFPLDITAINATLRSLEYREILIPTPNGINLSATLLQSWLLENARLGRRTPAIAAPPTSTTETPPAAPTRWAWVTPRLLRTLLIILIVLMIANVLAYVWVNSGAPSTPNILEPTVTLANP